MMIRLLVVLALGFTLAFSPDLAAKKDNPQKASKTTICHIPPDDPSNLHTIAVGNKALMAHLNHGDVEGECPSGCNVVTGSCDDANACTTDVCLADGLCLNEPVNCSDGVACTVDSCDALLGCSSTPEDSLCDPGSLCDAAFGCVAVGPVDADLDGFDETLDCNDNNSEIFPGAPESCDGLDNDCDGFLDNSCTVAIAAVYGDPHFRTFDHVNHHFQGQGVYTALRSTDGSFSIQLLMNESQQAAGITHVQAVAVAINGDVIEVAGNSGLRRSFINGDEFAGNTLQLPGGGTITNAGGRTELLSREGVRLYVRGDSSSGLTVVTALPLFLIGSGTAGLFGTYNGDSHDEFTAPDGTFAQRESSERVVYNHMQSWQVAPGDELFVYSSLPDVDPTFSPVFYDEVDPFDGSYPEQILDVCYSICGGLDSMTCFTDCVLKGGDDNAVSIFHDEELLAELDGCAESPNPETCL